ncbi:MAG: HNH endonuclease [Gammaproteobacteria bacterium]|nr:HNH endonuclease [Gammaproteobacteria bacterium]MBU1653687.1 HNH endonuclease [Gammaproteobacteria bacterium]MBU1962517.1 HNH endonuclease [Gammaproteobacteria bacterium]
MDKETGWNIHHILPKALGGADTFSNLVMLHPNCHRQIHSRDKVNNRSPSNGA